MLRFGFVFVACLGLATPSHAFFIEALDLVESLLKEHESDMKSLDSKLADINKTTRARVEKLLEHKWVTPKFRSMLIEGLKEFEKTILKRVEEYKILLAKEASKETPNTETVTPVSTDL